MGGRAMVIEIFSGAGTRPINLTAFNSTLHDAGDYSLFLLMSGK
jgi:hypothetical protein